MNDVKYVEREQASVETQMACDAAEQHLREAYVLLRDISPVAAQHIISAIRKIGGRWP